ncbi:MAG: glycosyltransferase family 4 protein [Planctomycetota bacterium]|nr:glycosyltransferase family 4 protein [Planctomycetota bacterium]
MRVCLFTPHLPPLIGGADRDADLILRGLQARGHDVSALAQAAPGPRPELPYVVERYRRPPMMHLCAETFMASLWRHHRRHPFDVVLAFDSYPTGYVAARLRRWVKFKVVASPRGSDLCLQYHNLRKPRVSGMIAEGYRHADRIVAISDWAAARVRELVGSNPPPIDLVFNGIDAAEHDRLLAASRSVATPLLAEEPFVLHLAKLHPNKNQALAVLAVARLRELFERRGLRYVIAGGGKDDEQLRAQVHAAGLDRIVKLVGPTVGAEKYRMLDRAMFLVATSREESFGNVVLEAMASGLPVLASAIGGHLQQVGSGGWGRMFESDNVDDLAGAMRAMIEADLSPLRTAALRRRNDFPLASMVEGYERSCLQALDSR